MSDLLEDLAEDYLEMPLLFSVELPAYMANRGMNPNILQYIMGHANITMTLGHLSMIFSAKWQNFCTQNTPMLTLG